MNQAGMGVDNMRFDAVDGVPEPATSGLVGCVMFAAIALHRSARG